MIQATKDGKVTQKLAEVVQEGKDEAKKEEAKKSELDKSKLNQITQISNRVLARASTVFPFDLFPSTIVVDDMKVTVILRTFFWTELIRSFDMIDISGIFVGSGPILASIELVSKNFIENNVTIKNFWKKDAINLRNVIEGIRMLTKEDVNTKDFQKYELLAKVKTLQENYLS